MGPFIGVVFFERNLVKRHIIFSTASLQEYIIDSESIRIEKYVRNRDESWIFRDYKSTHEKFSIETIQEELMIADVYLDTFG
jgi:hypothetical protein